MFASTIPWISSTHVLQHKLTNVAHHGSATQNNDMPAGADTINGVAGVAVVAAAVATEAPKIENTDGEVASKPAYVKIRGDVSGIRGEPCPTCQGNGANAHNL